MAQKTLEDEKGVGGGKIFFQYKWSYLRREFSVFVISDSSDLYGQNWN